MIKLSDRLELIANLIDKGETMADVGTDHGFLPMALWERGICEKIILTDVNEGPLEKATENIGKEASSIPLDLRLGNGLNPIQPGEVTTVVLAGMGGELMKDILSEDLEKTKSFQKIILQPRNGQAKLRFWLLQQGFQLVREELIPEGRQICEILQVLPPGENTLVRAELLQLPEIYFELPDAKLVEKNPLIKDLVRKKIRIEEKIIEKITASTLSDAVTREILLKKAKERIIYLEEYLKSQEEVA